MPLTTDGTTPPLIYCLFFNFGEKVRKIIPLLEIFFRYFFKQFFGCIDRPNPAIMPEP